MGPNQLKSTPIDLNSPQAMNDIATLAKNTGAKIDNPHLRVMYIAQQMGLGSGDSRVQAVYNDYLRHLPVSDDQPASQIAVNPDRTFKAGLQHDAGYANQGVAYLGDTLSGQINKLSKAPILPTDRLDQYRKQQNVLPIPVTKAKPLTQLPISSQRTIEDARRNMPANRLTKAEIAQKLNLNITDPSVTDLYDRLQRRAQGLDVKYKMPEKEQLDTSFLGSVNHGIANGLGGIYELEEHLKDAGSKGLNAIMGRQALRTDRFARAKKDFNDYNKEYEDSRVANGQTGIDWGSLLGNGMAAAPSMLFGGQAFNGAKILSPIGINVMGKLAAVGAGTGAMQYAKDGRELWDNMKSGALGNVIGGALGEKVIAPAVKMAAGTATRLVSGVAAKARIAEEAAANLDNALKLSGIHPDNVPKPVYQTLHQEAVQTVKGGRDLNAEAVANKVDILKNGMTATTGQLQRVTNPKQREIELVLAKQPAGQTLSDNFLADTKKIVDGLKRFKTDVGASTKANKGRSAEINQLLSNSIESNGEINIKLLSNTFEGTGKLAEKKLRMKELRRIFGADQFEELQSFVRAARVLKDKPLSTVVDKTKIPVSIAEKVAVGAAGLAAKPLWLRKPVEAGVTGLFQTSAAKKALQGSVASPVKNGKAAYAGLSGAQSELLDRLGVTSAGLTPAITTGSAREYNQRNR
ncbi:hypothetical protein [Aquirhabdus parva]|uniref:Uncharacterized protein n=1 Tax=Aquirhabdus parva TaxID=2283318 RepID=A0A345P982_9GAMM|nr:hypothetical protein [Aquirhabdus parva]AXI03841.1 hypothetical protein HYN46_13955 [Aquirhabdus parva]